MTEAELQDAVIDCAHLFGWQVAHFRPARTQQGWRTPVAADGKGFPDLVLVGLRVAFIELKSDKGKISGDQQRWLTALGEHSANVDVTVWRPCDWTSGTIESYLRTGVLRR